MMRWGGHVAYMGDENHNILDRKSDVKRTLRRPRCRWEDIRINIWEVQWEDVDWIQLV
jgi:hypothetical protein